jgi:hypothetical protein
MPLNATFCSVDELDCSCVGRLGRARARERERERGRGKELLKR